MLDTQLIRALALWVRRTTLRELELLLASLLGLGLLAPYLMEVELFLTVDVPAWTPIVLSNLLPAAIVIGFCAYYFYHLAIAPLSDPATAAADAKKEALDAQADGFSYEEQKQRSADWAAERAKRYAKEWAQEPLGPNAYWYKAPQPEPVEPSPENLLGDVPESKSTPKERAKKPSTKPRKAKASKTKVDAPQPETPKYEPRKPGFKTPHIDHTARTHIDEKKMKELQAKLDAGLKAVKAQDRARAKASQAAHDKYVRELKAAADRARGTQSQRPKSNTTPKPKAPVKTFYTVLGVSTTASQAEIKKAFKRLASQYHPDRGGDADKMTELNVANNTLKDTQKRARYDQQNNIRK